MRPRLITCHDLMLSNRYTIMSNYVSYHPFQDLELAKEMAEEDDDAY